MAVARRMGDPAHPVSVISGPHHRPGVSAIAPVSPLSVLASAGPKVLQCPPSPLPGAGHLPPRHTHCLWSRDRVAEAMCGGVDISIMV